MTNHCRFYNNFDWVTKDIQIEWVFGYEIDYDGNYQLGGPWWSCIKCDEIFYSTTLCMCESCNPFSGYCRSCSK